MEYKGSHNDVCIICPIHGEFLVQAYKHLQGQNCVKCKGFNRTTEEFVEKARKVHRR